MKNEIVKMAQYRLDARFAKASNLYALHPPHRGWIKAIREALGMTAVQLARRMGVPSAAVGRIERSEAAGTVKLSALQRAAAALDCRLVYALVPNTPLEAKVQKRRREIAETLLRRVEHPMLLENQAVTDAAVRERHLWGIMERIRPRELWEEG